MPNGEREGSSQLGGGKPAVVAVELEDATEVDFATLGNNTNRKTTDRSHRHHNTGAHSTERVKKRSVRRGIFLGFLIASTIAVCFYSAYKPPSIMTTVGLKSTTGALVLGAADESDEDRHPHEQAGTSSSTLPSLSPPLASGAAVASEATTGFTSTTTAAPVLASSKQHQQVRRQHAMDGQIPISSLIQVRSKPVCGGGYEKNTQQHSPQPPPVSSNNSSSHPTCPVFVKRGSSIAAVVEEDKEMDRSPKWVGEKYGLYASQCAAKYGMMWSKLRRTSHDAMLRRVLSLAVQQDVFAKGAAATTTSVVTSTKNNPSSSSTPQEGLPPSIVAELPLSELQEGLQRYAAGTLGGSSNALRVLDWGCGCGVGVDAISRLLQIPRNPDETTENNIDNPNNTSVSPPSSYIMRPEILGLDITSAAIQYAKEKMNVTEAADIQFCHADGSSLAWIPSDSYDMVVAFGSLLHLPLDVMCTAVSELLRVVRVGGIVWGGYIDSKDTASRLAACQVHSPCQTPNTNRDGTPYEVTVTVIKENAWFRHLGVPSANRKRKPSSLLWRKTSAK